MSIRRAPRPESNFYMLDKRISEDESLSWAARGLLIFLLGKPDHWEVSVQHLVNQTKKAAKRTARDGTYAILKELEASGYLTRARGRADGGEFSKVDYIVHEAPKPSPHPDKPDTVEPEVVDSPDTDKPDTVNPTQVSIEGVVRTDTEEERPADAGRESAADKTEDQPPSGQGDTKKLPNCPHTEILNLWAEIMPDKQQPSKNLWMGTERARHLAARWKAGFTIKHEVTGEPLYTDLESGLDWWGRFFHYLRKSQFLMGDNRWFKLSWVANKDNFSKILEKEYHDGGKA